MTSTDAETVPGLFPRSTASTSVCVRCLLIGGLLNHELWQVDSNRRAAGKRSDRRYQLVANRVPGAYPGERLERLALERRHHHVAQLDGVSPQPFLGGF